MEPERVGRSDLAGGSGPDQAIYGAVSPRNLGWLQRMLRAVATPMEMHPQDLAGGGGLDPSIKDDE